MRIENNPIGSVAIMGGIPTVPTPFLLSWTKFIEYNAKHLGDIHYLSTTVSFHAQARNSIVDMMKGNWVLMLDTDITFGPDILHRMLKRMEQHDLDVLVGMYQFKTHPYSPVLFNWTEKGLPKKITGYQAHQYDQFHYFPVDVAGAGCLLIKDSVFVRILEELKENPFDILPPLGEDFSFFNRLKRLGIQAVCDPAIHVEHLTWKGIQMSDFDSEAIGGTRRKIQVGWGENGQGGEGGNATDSCRDSGRNGTHAVNGGLQDLHVEITVPAES